MLTPKEIAEKTFDKTFGFGYRVDDVDAFLREAARSMKELQSANADLEKKLEVLADQITKYREDEESLRSALLGAQRLGDSVVRESKTKAEIIMRDATIKAEAMVNRAKRQIELEQDGLIKIQKEVASFKNRLIDLYRQHLELITALPGSAGRAKDAPEPAAPVPPAAREPAAPAPSAEDREPLPAGGETSPPPDFAPFAKTEPEQNPPAAEPEAPEPPRPEDQAPESISIEPPPARMEPSGEDDERMEEDNPDFPPDPPQEEPAEEEPMPSKFGELKFGSAFQLQRDDRQSRKKKNKRR